jgi:septal ring-binding cell division protein DamX
MGESLPEESLFGQRLSAGRQWLSAVTPDFYTIQLVTVFPGSDAVMERFRAQARQEGLLNDIYVCPVSSGEEPGKWMVVFKAFPEASAARAALAELPPSLCIYQPFVRNILTMRGRTPRLGRAG